MKTAVIAIIIAVFLLAAGGFYWRNNYFYKEKQGENNMKNSEMLASKSALEVLTEDITYIEGAKGFYAHPAVIGGEMYPGIVMIHEWWGLNDNIKNMARQLAGQGYQVLAVDLYRGQVAITSEDAQKYRNELTADYSEVNLKAAAKFLRDRNAPKLASLGWCFGGAKSLELALSGEQLDATVIYYGKLVTDKTQLQKIKWPVLGIFGETDQSIPISQVNEFRDALTSLGIQNSVNIYPGVGHAFANPSGANFAPEPTKEAWAKTLAFLKENLKR